MEELFELTVNNYKQPTYHLTTTNLLPYHYEPTTLLLSYHYEHKEH